MERKSKWWGVSEEDEFVPPSIPEYIPPKHYQFKKTKIHLGRFELPKETQGKIIRRIRIRFPVSLHRLMRLMKDRPFA